MASVTDILMLAPPTRALRAAKALEGKELTYPALPGEFVYPINYSPYGGGASVPQADIPYILAQDLDEHNAAVESGLEDTLASWWPGKDSQPRGGAVPASTVVSDVKVTPDNSIVVRFGNRGKYYTFKHALDPRDASAMVAELMANPAGLGRAISNGTRRHFTPGDEGVPDINVGSWRRDF